MRKPGKLCPGARPAASRSASAARAFFPRRYEAGKHQVEQDFEVTLVPTKHALKAAWLHANPAGRSADSLATTADAKGGT